ncbi:MAG: 4-(cytidine 5'-diphospho)-2-C-methyl-D-erythritol kinase [Gammaproteobacteria bacterium]
MTPMSLSPAKINTDLRITGRREDGRHLLETTMTLVNWGDDIHLSGRVDGKVWARWRHEHIKPQDELTMRAAKLLKKETGTRMGVDITVIKKIPVGGGLGGGSSNAAAALTGLNRLWRLKLKPAKLLEYAAMLGSDVPFFIFGKTARVSGADGLILREATADKCYFLLAMPNVFAETARVYEMHDRIGGGLEKPSDEVFGAAKICDNNDLALAAMHCYEAIARAAEAVFAAAGHAGLSGSGAAVFARFDDEQAAAAAQKQLPEGLPSVVVAALARHPFGAMIGDFGEKPAAKDEPVYEGERPDWYKEDL